MPDLHWLTEERALKRIKELRVRTLDNLRTLHYLKCSDSITCLDVDISAPEIDLLDKLVLQVLNNLESYEILPFASEGIWLKLRKSVKYTNHLIKFQNRTLLVTTHEVII